MATKHELPDASKALRCCINCLALGDASADDDHDDDGDNDGSSTTNNGANEDLKGVPRDVKLSKDQLAWLETKRNESNGHDGAAAEGRMVQSCMAMDEYTVFGIVRCKSSIAKCEGVQQAIRNIGGRHGLVEDEVVVKENIDLGNNRKSDSHGTGSMRILTLVGPKGCGKTHIGRLIERELRNATFLDVESIAIDYVSENSGRAESWSSASFRRSFYDRVARRVRELANAAPPGGGILIMETTGAAPEIGPFLADLNEQFGDDACYLVRIRSPDTVCAERINGRDASKQVDVSLEMIRKVHAATEALDWEWDLVLDNGRALSGEDVMASVRTLLGADDG
eukprot:CAMPEP_0181104430 /NCGR_PEP_ID=MMETSP1071-20121207/15424_1 /TAXON_ID=35127 /ORGANISM="Thalassiosira sp., Strain NH16" /LENGTH=338 /DNA_ID=CAMNT_0023187629 /DNA_START=111 /DNA_END=1127 /DNA_ORIENTATION=-